MRLSLRELLTLVGLLAVAIPLLLFGGPFASGLVLTLAVLISLAKTIQALVARGETQAAATGFAIVAVFYGGCVFASVKGDNREWRELEYLEGALPTSKVLYPLLSAAQRQRTYYVSPEGKTTRESPLAGTPLSYGGLGSGWRVVSLPQTECFMATGHSCWALFLGYIGSKYAASVHRKRTR